MLKRLNIFCNGFQVVGEANNGKTALEEISALCPDIAIIDINMPGYNGLELSSLLLKRGIDCNYIILTGYNEFKYAQQAVRLGVSDYILKPIDYTLLLTTLNELKEDILYATSLHRKINDLETEKKDSCWNNITMIWLIVISAATVPFIMTKQFSQKMLLLRKCRRSLSLRHILLQ